LNHSLVTVTA